MEETIRRAAKLLGAEGVECAGHGVRFVVRDAHGAELRVSINMNTQRLMAVVVDGTGTTRLSLDMAPVSVAFEESSYPGRVTLRVGFQLVHLDGKPSVGVEIESLELEERSKSQRLFLSGKQREMLSS
jgi:hypothetical protein